MDGPYCNPYRMFQMGEISGSVGFKGKNLYKDVKIIQELLNKSAKSTPATAALKVDGYCGPKTINDARIAV